jgi:hypothetical protein
MIYLYYDNKGKIVSTYTGPNISIQQTILPYVESEFPVDIKLHYILNSVVTKRPLNEVILDKKILTADGVDSIVFSNVTKGLFKAVNAITGETVSGEIDVTDSFSTTVTGTYKIKIEAFPYLDFEATIEAI